MGAPFKGEGPRIAAEAGVKRHGEPANAENERPEVHHAMLVAGHGVHLVAQVGGGHAGILDEGDPRVDARKFPREGSHEPVNECEKRSSTVVVSPIAWRSDDRVPLSIRRGACWHNDILGLYGNTWWCRRNG